MATFEKHQNYCQRCSQIAKERIAKVQVSREFREVRRGENDAFSGEVPEEDDDLPAGTPKTNGDSTWKGLTLPFRVFGEVDRENGRILGS